MAIEKFMFDLSFDEPTEKKPSAEEMAEQEALQAAADAAIEEAAPPPPTFSEEEVAAKLAAATEKARTSAHAQGLEQGRAEVMAMLEKSLAETEQLIGAHIAQIGEIQAREHAKQAEDTVNLAMHVIRKLLPGYTARHPLLEVEHVLGDCLGRLFDAPKVLLSVNPELVEPLESRMVGIAKARGFDGQIMVIGEPEVALGDCRVDWGDGSAERNSKAVWDEIDEIVERALTAHRAEAEAQQTDGGGT